MESKVRGVLEKVLPADAADTLMMLWRLDDGPAALDGIDLSAALTGSNNTQSRDELLLEADPHASPLDGKDWGGDQHATPYYALRSGRWKLIIGDPGQPGEVATVVGF